MSLELSLIYAPTSVVVTRRLVKKCFAARTLVEEWIS